MFISISRDLLHRADRKEDGENLYLLFQNLRLKMLSNCQEEWTIERLCQEVNLEKEPSFMFITTISFPPPRRLTSSMYAWKKAKSLLSNEALQVQEAAVSAALPACSTSPGISGNTAAVPPGNTAFPAKQKEEPVPGSSQ